MKNIQLIAPASYLPNLTKKSLIDLRKKFQKLNFNFNYSKYIFEKKYFLAGTDSQRKTDLMNAFKNPKVDILLALRGGEGSLRLLDKIDYNFIKKHPKIFFGFSDTTALQNALWEKAKLPSYSGFIGWYAMKDNATKLFKNFQKAIENRPQQLKVKVLKKGSAKGTMIGGSLSSFISLLGTPYQPNIENKILLLEEVKEPPYHLDRLFAQLRLAGVFSKIKGLVLGDLTAKLSPQEKKMAQAIIQEYIKEIKCPIVSLPSYSHNEGTAILPIGGTVEINTQKNILTLDKINIFD